MIADVGDKSIFKDEGGMKIELKNIDREKSFVRITLMTEVFEVLMRALKKKFIGTIELNFLPTGKIKISVLQRNVSEDDLTKLFI